MFYTLQVEPALQEGRMREAVVRLDDLPRVQAFALVNSLRAWMMAQLVGGVTIVSPFGEHDVQHHLTQVV